MSSRFNSRDRSSTRVTGEGGSSQFLRVLTLLMQKESVAYVSQTDEVRVKIIQHITKYLNIIIIKYPVTIGDIFEYECIRKHIHHSEITIKN